MTQSTNNGTILSFNYDNNGNLLSETKDGKATTYSYDVFNRVTEVTKPDGSWQGNVYDALGLRTAMLENGIYTGFTFDRGSVISEVNASDKSIGGYLRGLNLVAQKDSKGVLNYYLHNAHGDGTSIVDASGKALNSYSYDAFGNTLGYTEKVANRFMYAGEQFDKMTGQYYLRARYYDPMSGRFTQEDSYRGDGLNLYAYVANNPVKYVDPMGYCKDDAQGTGNLTLTDEMKKVGVKIVTIDGKQYYDYSEPINTVFWNAAVEASNHKGDLNWFKSKVNHSADWDIKRKEPWEKTVGTPFPGSYDAKIIVNGSLTTPEELGNMMYGYTGTAADISETVLIAGSMYAASIWGVVTDKDKRTNEFNDHDIIRKGIQWYKKDKEDKEK